MDMVGSFLAQDKYTPIERPFETAAPVDDTVDLAGLTDLLNG